MAACIPFCQGEASWARAAIGENEVSAAKTKRAADRELPNVGARSAGVGTIAFMKRA
jgi:hypothetical protein